MQPPSAEVGLKVCYTQCDIRLQFGSRVRIYQCHRGIRRNFGLVSRALFPLESSSSDKQIKVRQNLLQTYDHTDFAHLGILNPSAHCICTAELTILKKI